MGSLFKKAALKAITVELTSLVSSVKREYQRRLRCGMPAGEKSATTRWARVQREIAVIDAVLCHGATPGDAMIRIKHSLRFRFMRTGPSHLT